MKRVNIKCPYCGSRAFLRPAAVVYGQGCKEPDTELYVCARFPACDAYVAAHRHNHLPMGTLANRELRRKRIQAHTAFNQLWQSGLMTKRAAYHWLPYWLQVQLGLPQEEAHIANFSEWRCDQVIQLCGRFLAPGSKAA